MSARPRADGRAAGGLRGKVTGGSSAINGEIFLRGIPEDFDGWAARGNDLWSFERVLPVVLPAGARPRLRRARTTAPTGRSRSAAVRPDEWLPPQDAFVEACRDGRLRRLPGPQRARTPRASARSRSTTSTACAGAPASATSTRPADRAEPDDPAGLPGAARRCSRATERSGSRSRRGGSRARSTATRSSSCAGRGRVAAPADALRASARPTSSARPACRCCADLPGVGQNLRDHPHVGALWRPRAGYPMDPELPRYQVALRYTAPGSRLRNDMQILMISFATGRVDRGGDGRTPLGIAHAAGAEPGASGRARSGSARPTGRSTR